VQRAFKDKPPRLHVLFQRFNAPVYFVTFNTHIRANLLADPAVHAGFVEYCRRVADFRTAVGLDRVLLSIGREPLNRPGQKLSSFWQPGFNDHLLRSDESYAEKWDYVFQNPVRAGLINHPEGWPYAGEIVRIDRT
jgi:hypothetical protein